jgi:type II secretory pathway component GspD/PulD (secretin)
MTAAHHTGRGLFKFLTALLCLGLASGCVDRSLGPQKHTFSSFDPPRGAAAALQYDTGKLQLADADVDQVLNLYQEVSARTVIRSPNLPPVKISLRNQMPLTRVETLQLLDTALVQNGITMVLVGDTSVKAVPNREAMMEPAPTLGPDPVALPDSSSYMTCTVGFKNANAKDLVEVVKPFARMQNSIICLPSTHLLILRDYSANIRQMLRLIQQIDRLPPSAPRPSGSTTNKPSKRL